MSILKFEIFQRKLSDNYGKSFPKKKTKKCSNDKPYINEPVKAKTKEKIRLLRNGKKDEANHKMIKKKVEKQLPHTIKNTMKDIFNYNSKKWYDLVKKLPGKQISSLMSLVLKLLMISTNTSPRLSRHYLHSWWDSWVYSP